MQLHLRISYSYVFVRSGVIPCGEKSLTAAATAQQSPLHIHVLINLEDFVEEPDARFLAKSFGDCHGLPVKHLVRTAEPEPAAGPHDLTPPLIQQHTLPPRQSALSWIHELHGLNHGIMDSWTHGLDYITIHACSAG